MSFIHTPAGASSTLRTTTPMFALGTVGTGTNGTRWIYVKATAAISAYYVAAIDESFNATPATAALATQGHIPGFCQTAFASGDYGFIPTAGTSDLKVKTAAATVKDSALYIGSSGASDGVVASTTTGGNLLNGVVTVSTAASGGVLPYIIATNPWFTP